jgi:hypothetical protein
MQNNLEKSELLFENFDMVLMIITSSCFNFDDLVKLRYINKTFNNAVLSILKKKIDLDSMLHGKATFICMSICWNCEINCSSLRQICYVQDTHPNRVIISCNKLSCRLLAYKSYLYESFYYEKKIILYEPLKLDKCIIPRSDGSTSNGTINNKYIIILNDELHLQVNFYSNNEYLTKCCSLNDLYDSNTGVEKLQFTEVLNDIKIHGIKYQPFMPFDIRETINNAIQKLN